MGRVLAEKLFGRLRASFAESPNLRDGYVTNKSYPAGWLLLFLNKYKDIMQE